MKITVTTNELRTMAQVDANIGQRLFNRIAMSNSNLEVKVLKARAEIKEEINGIELWYDNSKHEVSLEISEEIMLDLIREFGNIASAITTILFGSKKTFQNMMLKYATEEGSVRMEKRFSPEAKEENLKKEK
jgi:hypothetical protein